MALTSYTFAQLLTFARASTKMLFNSTSVMALVAAGVPGFSYDPVTNAARGLSIEEAATNLVFPSAGVSTLFATKVDMLYPGTLITGPDGTSSMEKLTCDSTANALHYNQYITSQTGTQQMTLEFWAKAAEFSKFQIAMFNNSNLGENVTASVDLGAGTISTSKAGTAAIGQGEITPYSNGVYKIAVTFTITTVAGSTGVIFRFIMSNAAGAQTFNGDGTSGFYLGGFNLKLSGTPSSYIPTTTAAATRVADICTVTSLSPWFNAPAGTIFAQARMAHLSPAGKNQVLVRFDDGTDNNKIEIRNPAGTSNIEVLIVSGGATVFQQVGGTFTAGSVVQAAVSYASSAFAISVNGGAAISGATGAVPVGISRCLLGVSGIAGTDALNGELQDINYYPVAIAGTSLAAIT